MRVTIAPRWAQMTIGTSMAPDSGVSSQELHAFAIDTSAAVTRPTTIKALEYWRSRKGDRAMPSRADISPSALRSLLPMIALVEIPGAGDRPTAYTIRLAGDAIHQVFGPLTGKPIDEFLPPDVLKRWTACFEAARSNGAPVRVTTSQVVYQDKTWLQAEVLLAPLGLDGRVTMLLAAVDTWPAMEA
jgi:hypothetical protein